MVARHDASLYTIEGVAAAALMIATATIVFQAMSIYTPGDTHIDDMLLEQLGADALAVMDLPTQPGARTELEEMINSWDRTGFHETFYQLLRTRSLEPEDPVQYSAVVTYRVGEDVISIPFTESAPFTGYDPAIRVTRLVQIRPPYDLNLPLQLRRGSDQAVLLEVFLWRG
ncbi:MAG: hypothetical protein Q7J09_04180 [Methanocalculus sp.]|uniref:DUF7288 family protein n=1 Tax=Methanocalculus sp. TaxID=2004547 RepID=UPI002728A563|nr:hypothetical protein [Methanocalculus sp.]MDO9539185.1 hypothetical protein [Methanocalculus sp.]